MIYLPGMRYHCIGNGRGGASESNVFSSYFVWIQKDNHLNLIEEVRLQINKNHNSKHVMKLRDEMRAEKDIHFACGAVRCALPHFCLRDHQPCLIQKQNRYVLPSSAFCFIMFAMIITRW